MNDSPDWLEKVRIGNDVLYPFSAIFNNFKLVSLPLTGLLILDTPDDFRIRFALLEWNTLDESGETFYKLVSHGEGPSEELREMRHADDGYVFHVELALIEFAFKELRKYYD